MTVRYMVADVFDGLASLEDGSVDLVITSPPFLALRSYLPADHPDKGKEIGSEPTPAEFLDTLLAVTSELRRVLAPHGSIAIELGDTYAGSGGAGGDYTAEGWRAGQEAFTGSALRNRGADPLNRNNPSRGTGGSGWPMNKCKALIPQLYEVALAYGFNPLTGAESPAGRWRIRNVVTWARPNPPVGALGDKWRPATSDVVVACLSGKRYWDDLATRRPFKTEDHPMGTGTVAGEPGVKVERGYGPHGAPLLDYWEIPPGGYKGAHYAVFPPALVEPLVKAMCPEKVCRTCGEPSRRIVGEASYVNHRTGEPTDNLHFRKGERKAENANQWGATGQDNGAVRQVDTLGWTDCGHGTITCNHCGVLVPSDYAAIRRSRETPSGSTGVGQKEILGEPIEGTSGQTQASEGVRDLRSGLPGADKGQPSLQSELFGEVRAHGRSDAFIQGPDGSEEPELAGRSEDQPSGLHSDMGSTGVSGSTEERIHDGTSDGDAGTSRSAAGAVGVGSSQERDQGRQPDRESGDREPRQASGNGDLPELRDGVSAPLDGYVCPCGSTDFKYVADQYRPGLTLDPFAGSGTTLAVASGHGHEALGIDIDPRNQELARERVGPFFFEEITA